MPIRQQNTRVSDDGATLHELASALGDPSIFFALITHGFQLPNGQPIQDQFRLDIEATSIAEAFEKLRVILPEAVKNRAGQILAQFEVQRRQIVLPSGQKLPPNGHPHTRFK